MRSSGEEDVRISNSREVHLISRGLLANLRLRCCEFSPMLRPRTLVVDPAGNVDSIEVLDLFGVPIERLVFLEKGADYPRNRLPFASVSIIGLQGYDEHREDFVHGRNLSRWFVG